MIHRLALLALVLAGCADPCEDGQTECVDGSTIRRCVGTRDGWSLSYDWAEPEACYAINPYCVTRDDVGPNVTPQAKGLCASAPAKSAMCTGGNFCTGGTSYKCFDGYAVLWEICPNGCAASGPDCAP